MENKSTGQIMNESGDKGYRKNCGAGAGSEAKMEKAALRGKETSSHQAGRRNFEEFFSRWRDWRMRPRLFSNALASKAEEGLG